MGENISEDTEHPPGTSTTPRLVQVPGGQGPHLMFSKAVSPMPRTVLGTWEAINKY